MAVRRIHSGALASNTSGVQYTSVIGTPTYGSDASGYYTDCVSAGVGCSILDTVNGSDTTGILYVGFRFRFVGSLPSANDVIFRFVNSANTSMCEVIFLLASGKLRLRDSSSVSTGLDTAAIVADTDYYLEISIDSTTTPGGLGMKLNGVSIGTAANDIQGTWAKFRIGNISTPTATMRVRDVYAVDDVADGGPTTYLGQGRAVFMYPNAAGDNNAMTDQAAGAGTTNNYTLVDEQPPDDATTYAQSLTSGTTDMYNVTPSGISAADNVKAVQVSARATNILAGTTTTVLKYQIEKTSGGTISQSAAYSPNTTTWRTNGSNATLNPFITLYNDPDGNPWTQTTLDSMQIGQTITTTGLDTIATTAIWAYAWVTPSTGNFFQMF